MILPALQMLLNARTSGGMTALMKAASCCSSPTIYYLLKLGADPLLEDDKGRTARRYAIAYNPNHVVVAQLQQAELPIEE